MSGNEASAIGSLRAINSGQASFSSSCAAGGYAVDLADLVKAPANSSQGFISPDLKSNGVTKSGYTVTIAKDGASGVQAIGGTTVCGNTVTQPQSSYFAKADPVTVGRHGHPLLRDRHARHHLAGHRGDGRQPDHPGWHGRAGSVRNPALASGAGRHGTGAPPSLFPPALTPTPSSVTTRNIHEQVRGTSRTPLRTGGAWRLGDRSLRPLPPPVRSPLHELLRRQRERQLHAGVSEPFQHGSGSAGGPLRRDLVCGRRAPVGWRDGGAPERAREHPRVSLRDVDGGALGHPVSGLRVVLPDQGCLHRLSGHVRRGDRAVHRVRRGRFISHDYLARPRHPRHSRP